MPYIYRTVVFAGVEGSDSPEQRIVNVCAHGTIPRLAGNHWRITDNGIPMHGMAAALTLDDADTAIAKIKRQTTAPCVWDSEIDTMVPAALWSRYHQHAWPKNESEKMLFMRRGDQVVTASRVDGAWHAIIDTTRLSDEQAQDIIGEPWITWKKKCRIPSNCTAWSMLRKGRESRMEAIEVWSGNEDHGHTLSERIAASGWFSAWRANDENGQHDAMRTYGLSWWKNGAIAMATAWDDTEYIGDLHFTTCPFPGPRWVPGTTQMA